MIDLVIKQGGLPCKRRTALPVCLSGAVNHLCSHVSHCGDAFKLVPLWLVNKKLSRFGKVNRIIAGSLEIGSQFENRQ